MRRRHPHDRAVELVEDLFGDDGCHLGPPATQARVFLDGEEATGCRPLTQDGGGVKRHERAYIDHRAIDTLACKLFGPFEGS
jgi:hypothetical protein